ncbi:MAG TPA: isochorismatase family cysteine hydrolase, partial [Rhizomicrobium sp.]|nr:isochorismatase family cysteine hydrolase [Rhizomicrobium sp.]
LIDTQNDFTLPDAPARIAGTTEVVPAIARLLDRFRQLQRPVFHVIRLYRADGSNADLCRRTLIENGGAIVRPGTKGAEIVEALKPDAAVMLDADTLLAGEAQALGTREWALYKPRWSAFYGTRLEMLLKAQDVNTLVFAGCNFPNCPRSSIYDASSRDFRLVIATDAISGLYDKGLQELRGIGAALMTAAEPGDWLSAS